MSLKLMYITNDLDVALIAQKFGVDRIWIDLETLGKEERQFGIDTVKSQHTISDIARIKPFLTKSEMLVRINPINPNSKDEIDAVISAGADMIMLPYWKTKNEVTAFLESVNGRCKTTLLLETKEAVKIVDEVLEIPGIDEIHIGLNDLHLSYGLTFMFELLTNGVVESLCDKFKRKGIPYGFGGIAKIGEGMIPAEKIILEHYRLGSTRAILSRSFCNYLKLTKDAVNCEFESNMSKLRAFEMHAQDADEETFERNRLDLIESVDHVVEIINKKRYGGDCNA